MPPFRTEFSNNAFCQIRKDSQVEKGLSIMPTMDKGLEYYCRSVLGMAHLFKPSELKDFGLQFAGDFVYEPGEAGSMSSGPSQDQGGSRTDQRAAESSEASSDSTEFHFIGEPRDLVLVIPWQNFSSFESSEEFQLLKKIIGAMKLNLSDILIALYADFQALMESEQMRELHQAIFFGRNEKIPFPSHELIHQSGKTLLVTSNLETMLEKPETKRQVWMDLQEMLKEMK